MPIYKSISSKIIEFSLSENPDEMISYLENQLIESQTNPTELLEFARDEYSRKQKAYIISAKHIDNLGDVIGKLDNPRHSAMHIEFYKLSADRHYFLGKYHYCKALLDQDPNAALSYSEKMFFLSGSKEAELQYVHYIKALCYEKLNLPDKAMDSYCKIINIDFQYYSVVIASRARLIKNQVCHDLTQTTLTFSERFKYYDFDFAALNSILLPIKFHEQWFPEFYWFNSVDENNIQNEFNSHIKKLEELAATKKTEITILLQRFNEENEIVVRTLKEKKAALDAELIELNEIQNSLNRQYNLYLPANRQIFRNHAAERHFFNPNRSNKKEKINRLTEEIIDQRFQQQTNLIPVNLDGLSSRLIISSEKAFQNAVITLTDENKPRLGISVARNITWHFQWRSGAIPLGPVEYYQVGKTKVQLEHRVMPKRDRLGAVFLPQCGSYDSDFYPYLSKLSNNETEKEKTLTSWMIRYGKAHQSVSLNELKSVYLSATIADADKFNQFCFLIIDKEQSQWLSAKNKIYQIGMSVSQARCLILLREGIINFKDAFVNNPIFGVYSHKALEKHINIVIDACRRIDALYITYLQHQHPIDHFSFIKKNIHRPKTAVLTREQAHQDMKTVYGGDSDTDGTEYDSDLELGCPKPH
ncbi:MAG: hypothetical protein NTZ67_09345 [Gammaproteobacteria bacterium]|nr:hypothetical protein [Gammaproteobacteria bacterium]